MASITKIEGPHGTGYRIVVAQGRDQDVKQVRHIKTWNRSPE